MNNEALIAEAREFLASENAQYYDSSLVRSLVVALEAATRVPVQGEPNGDRKAAMAEADRRFPEVVFAPENEQLAEIFLSGAEWALSRATVPDAAFEEMERLKTLVDLREFEIDNLDELITELKAERDAATAAIERVRAIHEPVEIEPSSTICGECSFKLPNGKYFGKVVEFPCDTRAALDGAPEPEEKQ